MEIGVREVAKLLSVSEKTIYRWIRKQKMPGFKVGEQYRFSRAEILEWATSKRLSISTEIFDSQTEKESPAPSPGLKDALSAGGIFYRVEGSDKAAVLSSAVNHMPLPPDVDKSFLARIMMARESMGSTGIGDGIAVPHVRNPIVMHIPKPIMSLCFLENKIDFGAMDGIPVGTLFTIVSPVISAHLSLLSKLAFALRQPAFSAAVKQQDSREAIINAAAAADALIEEKNRSIHGDTVE